jgi:CubicO group peptidase (beta-lactamase class C family)
MLHSNGKTQKNIISFVPFNNLMKQFSYLPVVLLSVLILSVSCGINDPDFTDEMPGGPAILSEAPPPAEHKFAHYKTRVEEYVDSLIGKSYFAGGILVAKEGEIIFEKYYGTSDGPRGKDTVTAHTPFHLASVSKPLTAAGILKLVQKGRLNLDDSAYKFLPGFPFKDVTIKTLLNHRSGLPNYGHYMDQLGWDRSVNMTNNDVLQFINEHQRAIGNWKPDTRFSYSNTNFALLALVIENITGKSFPEYMKSEIFEPLGMDDSFVYQPADSLRATWSYYYSGRKYAFDFLDLVFGDKNIYSTPQDLLKFERALTSGSFISPALLNVVYSGFSYEKRGVNNYGLGWRLIEFPHGKKLVYHQGWWHGSRTALYRLPEEDVTIIAVSNNDSKKVYNLRFLADIFGNYFNTAAPVHMD